MQDLTDELSTTSDRIWPKLNLLIGAMIAIVVGVTVLFQAMPVTEEKAQQDEHIAKLQSAIDSADMRNRRLAKEVDALQRDPEYSGIIARDRLGLMKEGETILRLEPQKK